MSEHKLVRVKPPACAIRHPEHGEMVVPNPAQAYAADDPLVLAHPWQFETDAEREARGPEKPVTEVAIEQATARPGEKRGPRRTR